MGANKGREGTADCFLHRITSLASSHSAQICSSGMGLAIVVITILFTFISNLFYFILFLAVLGLCCCARVYSSCGDWELHFMAVRGLLIAGASLCFGARALGVQASVVVARGP